MDEITYRCYYICIIDIRVHMNLCLTKATTITIVF